MLTGRRAKEQALIAIPGIGQLTARGLPAPAPELGRFSHKAIASIAGLAPHLRDSGQFLGYRRMRPGRTGSRPLLFMAAFAGACSHPRLQDFYRRLLVAGRARRRARVAVARKRLIIANATRNTYREALT
jgi:transposase